MLRTDLRTAICCVRTGAADRVRTDASELGGPVGGPLRTENTPNRSGSPPLGGGPVEGRGQRASEQTKGAST